MEELEREECSPNFQSSENSGRPARPVKTDDNDHSSRNTVSAGINKHRDSDGEFHKQSMAGNLETNYDNMHNTNDHSLTKKSDYATQNDNYKNSGGKGHKNYHNYNEKDISRVSSSHRGGFNSNPKGTHYNSQMYNKAGAYKGHIKNAGSKYADKNYRQCDENYDRGGGNSRQQKVGRGNGGYGRQQYYQKYSDNSSTYSTKHRNSKNYSVDMRFNNSKSARGGCSSPQLFQSRGTTDVGGNGSVRERTENENDLIQQFQKSMLLQGEYTPEDVNAVNAKLLIDKSREIQDKNKSINMKDMRNVNRICEQSLQIKINEQVRNIVGRTEYSGFPGCLPVEINHKNISKLRTYPYKVSWKADGTRYLMLIEGAQKIYLIGTNLKSIFHISKLEFRQKNDLTLHLSDTLLDGELIIDVNPHTGVKLIRFLIFDAIRVEGKNVASENFDKRYEIIKTDIINPRNTAITEGLLDTKQEPFTIQQKIFWDASPQIVKKLLSKSFLDQIGHKTDGLMFHCNKGPYVSGVTDTVLKFKPVALTSIDFRLKIVYYKRERYGELYVGSSYEPFGDIEITKELENLHNQIIECSYTETGWLFRRHRTDRTYPNAYKTALSIWETICNPVYENYLIDYIT